MTNLVKKGTKHLAWNPLAEAALQQLKTAFTTAPILKHLGPTKPFLVEVDASETGVGHILSQYFGEKPKLHPVAYYSKKLTPAEQSYDIGNRELLTIKLALVEWHHWLEGAVHPFTIFTNHKNQEYIKTAKRLNSLQAQRSLFFAQFHFTISY